jgi:tetratricopeptide (TPR) repeat protein
MCIRQVNLQNDCFATALTILHLLVLETLQVPLPPYVNDVPVGLLSGHFTGREKDLGILEEMLDKVQSDRPGCVAIHGMPGIGKSQLLLRYAVKSFEGDRYSHVFWTSASSVDKLTNGLCKILDLVHPDRYIQDQSVKLTATRSWLEECSFNWLLIVDNVDTSTLNFLRTHFPRRNSRGNVIFSTRTVVVAQALLDMARTPHSILQLHALDVRDATSLLFNDAGIDSTFITSSLLSLAEELVQSVGRLPLAVVQAASFMKETDISLGDMLKLYKSKDKIEVCIILYVRQPSVYIYKQAIRWESDLTIYEERSVAATFSRQFEQLNGESLDFSNLLKVFSFLDSENIPLDMMIQGAKEWLRSKDVPSRSKSNIWKETWNESVTKSRAVNPTVSLPEFHSLATLIISPIKFRAALQKLQGLSLVERRSGDGHSSVSMHDLIKFIMQDSARQEETYMDWLCLSISIICGTSELIDDLYSPHSWKAFEKLIPHLQSLDQIWRGTDGINLELSRANARIATYMFSRGRYQEAEALCARVLADYEEHLGDNDPATLASMANLAFAYSSQGRFEEAESLHKRALAGRQMHLGADHMDTLESMSRLAHVYKVQGRYNEAKRLHRRALAGRSKHLGADHQDTLTSIDNLGLIYYRQERYDEAEALHWQAVVGREKHLGITHRVTLDSMHHLALVYSAQRRYEEAEALLKQQLTAVEKLLGADHPDTLVSVYNLGGIYLLQRQYGEAEAFHQRALVGRERQLGATHRVTLDSMHHLALVYTARRQYEKAEALLKQQLTAVENSLGADHPDTLISVYNLGGVYLLQRRYGEAEVHHRRALLGREKHLGTTNRDTLDSMNNLGIVYMAQRRYEEAEELHLQAIAGAVKLLGADHPRTLSSVNNLGYVYELQQRYGEAEALYQQALAGREKFLGASSMDTLISAIGLGLVYELQGRHADANALLHRVLTRREKHIGADHQDTHVLIDYLGHVHQSQERYEKAKALLHCALEGRKKQLGVAHQNTLGSTNNLTLLYTVQGRHGDVAAPHRELKGRERQKHIPHLQFSSQNRVDLPRLHCFPDSHGQSSPVAVPEISPMQSPLSQGIVHSPQPSLSPMQSFVNSPPKNERVKALERMAEEVTAQSKDLSQDIPKVLDGDNNRATGNW